VRIYFPTNISVDDNIVLSMDSPVQNERSWSRSAEMSSDKLQYGQISKIFGLGIYTVKSVNIEDDIGTNQRKWRNWRKKCEKGSILKDTNSRTKVQILQSFVGLHNEDLRVLVPAWMKKEVKKVKYSQSTLTNQIFNRK
ncbi:Hypothetical predicted protein, partial [Olea europaea subsp. europaea]